MTDYTQAGSWVHRSDELDARDDERIQHYERQRQNALDSIRSIDVKHVRHFDFVDDREVDVTDEHRAFEQSVVERMTHLIQAWQRIKASRA